MKQTDNVTQAKNDSSQRMLTLSECSNKAVKEGYTESFKVVTKGLTNEKETKFYTPEETKIVSFYRFEGYSDPQDNAILYQIETTDGKKGILIDAYGAYADAKVSTFIRSVEDIHKEKENNE